MCIYTVYTYTSNTAAIYCYPMLIGWLYRYFLATNVSLLKSLLAYIFLTFKGANKLNKSLVCISLVTIKMLEMDVCVACATQSCRAHDLIHDRPTSTWV